MQDFNLLLKLFVINVANINHKPLFHSGTEKKLSCFGYFKSKVQEAYNDIIFLFLMENSILKIFDSVNVKITHDFSS